MAEVQIQSVNHMHDQIMNWLIANPEKLLRDCARHFNITQTWLSIVIHSDVFKARFRERQDYVFRVVAADVPEKLHAAASMVTDQLMEQLEKNTDRNFTLDAFDKILHRAGYAPASSRNGGGSLNVQVNTYTVDKAVLAEARARIGVSTPQAERVPLEIEAVAAEVVMQNPLPPAPENSEADKTVWAVLNLEQPQGVSNASAETE